MRLFAGSLLIIVIILGFSCSNSTDSDDDKDGSSTEGVIMPLSEGNQWGFVDTEYDSLGAVQRTGVALMTIIKDTLIEDEVWYRATMAWDTTAIDDWGLYTNRQSGLWIMEPGDSPELFLKYPVIVGDAYYIDDAHGRMVVVATDTVITVPHGTYSCILYHYVDADDGEVEEAHFMCPNVGWVRADYYNRTASGEEFIENCWKLQTLIAD